MFEKKYQSRHKVDTFITVGQWVGEVMCERKAQREGSELPQAFWLSSYKDNPELKKWYDYLAMQITLAYKKIKKHGEEKLLLMLKRNRGIYSLGPKWVDEKIASTIVPKIDETKVEYDTTQVKSYRKAQENKRILSLLEDL